MQAHDSNGASTPPALESPLIGRQHELAHAKALAARVLRGEFELVCIIGEAGIGKSRLLRELAAAVQAQGLVPVWGRCWEQARSIQMFPWTQIGRALSCSAIAAFVDGSEHRGHDDRTASLLQIADEFSQVAQGQSVCLLLDDLQWADETSLLLLELLCRLKPGLMVAVAWRGHDALASPWKWRTLQSCAKDGQRWELAGLTSEQIAELFASRGRPLSEQVSAEVRRRTGGNPFFLEEVLRSFDSDALTIKPTEGVTAQILQRVELLSPQTQAVLRAASVLGHEVTVAGIANMLAESQSAVGAALRDAVRAGCLEPGAEKYHFRHDLVRESVYETLPPAQREHWHERAARLLMDATEERHAAAIFEHLLLAEADADLLARWAIAAAETHLKALAYEAALETCERARALGSITNPARVNQLLLLRAQALACLNERAAAREACRDLAERARQAGQPELFAEAALLFGVGSEFSVVDEEHVSLLTSAVSSLGSTTTALSLRLRARLAAALQPSNDPLSVVAMGKQVLRDARAHGDRRVLASVLTLVRGAFRPVDDLQERYQIDREALLCAREHGDQRAELDTLGRLVSEELERGHMAAAAQYIEELSSLARKLLSPSARALALRQAASLATLRGDSDEARRLLDQATLHVGNELPTSGFDGVSLQRVVLARWWGDPGSLREALRCSRSPMRIPSLLAVAHAFLGDDATARRYYEEIAERPYHENYVDLFVRPELCCVYGNADQAARCHEHLQQFRNRHVVFGGAFAACDGSVERHLGLLACRAGMLDEAIHHLRRAALENAKVAHGPVLAMTRTALAQVLRLNQHNDAEAEALSAEVAAYFERRSKPLDPLLRHPLSGAAQRMAPMGRVERQQSSKSADAKPAAPTFRCLGELWNVGYRGRSVTIPDSDGIRYLAYLVERPHALVHVLDLMSLRKGAAALESEAATRPRDTELIVGPDQHALAQYRKRLRALQDAEEHALSLGNHDAANQAQAERLSISNHLARELGLGGRRRKRGTAERARVNVTQRIRQTIKRLAEWDATLGHHLQSCIKTGQICCYTPPPAA